MVIHSIIIAMVFSPLLPLFWILQEGDLVNHKIGVDQQLETLVQGLLILSYLIWLIKKKYKLFDQFNTNVIYRYDSYGPTLGGGRDLYLADQCKSNSNSYCTKNSYNTGNNNLLGENGTTQFQVTTYEVYQVVFD